MWYQQGTDRLDYSKPIIAKSKDSKYCYLLMPVREVGTYRVTGYDWFNIVTGEWNSHVEHQTPQKAVDSYKPYMKVSNVDLSVLYK